MQDSGLDQLREDTKKCRSSRVPNKHQTTPKIPLNPFKKRLRSYQLPQKSHFQNAWQTQEAKKQRSDLAPNARRMLELIFSRPMLAPGMPLMAPMMGHLADEGLGWCLGLRRDFLPQIDKEETPKPSQTFVLSVISMGFLMFGFK